MVRAGINREALPDKQVGNKTVGPETQEPRPDWLSWGFLGAPGRVRHPATADPYPAIRAKGQSAHPAG